jgi:hypothetical protein
MSISIYTTNICSYSLALILSYLLRLVFSAGASLILGTESVDIFSVVYMKLLLFFFLGGGVLLLLAAWLSTTSYDGLLGHCL